MSFSWLDCKRFKLRVSKNIMLKIICRLRISCSFKIKFDNLKQILIISRTFNAIGGAMLS